MTTCWERSESKIPPDIVRTIGYGSKPSDYASEAWVRWPSLKFVTDGKIRKIRYANLKSVQHTAHTMLAVWPISNYKITHIQLQMVIHTHSVHPHVNKRNIYMHTFIFICTLIRGHRNRPRCIAGCNSWWWYSQQHECVGLHIAAAPARYMNVVVCTTTNHYGWQSMSGQIIFYHE